MIKLRTFFYQIENIFSLKILGGGGRCPSPTPVTAFGYISAFMYVLI